MTTSISERVDKDLIRARAGDLGFDACGFASAQAPWRAGERLAEFVGEGRHGSMDWMETTAERRAPPAGHVAADARSPSCSG